MNLSQYIPLVISYIIALFAIMRDYDKSSKSKKIIDWFGGIAFTVLTIFSVYNQYSTSQESDGHKRQIDSLLRTDIDLKRNSDSLKETIAEQELAEILNQKDRVSSTGEINNDGRLAERFLYLTTIPDGNGKIMFAIHNPLSITIHNVYLTISGYGRIKGMKSKVIDGIIVYSKKDLDASIIYYQDSLEVKPGVHILPKYHLQLGMEGSEVPEGDIAAFEIYFIGPKYHYVEQLGTKLSDDHFSSLNAYLLYKLSNTDKSIIYKLIDANVPSLFGDFNKMFTMPVARVYSSSF